MEFITSLHPFWLWLALAAVILVAELSTGSGWLLWPAATAALMALLSFLLPPSFMIHAGLYAVLTIAATVTARKYLPGTLWGGGGGPDINDNRTRLIGARGEAASLFAEGRGRVHVEGKEWDAFSDEPLLPGKAVVVTEVIGAASLRVKAT